MSDLMKIAQQRREKLQTTIQKREAEIAALREEIENVDMFIDYAKHLVEEAGGERPPAAQQPVKIDRTTSSEGERAVRRVQPQAQAVAV